MQTRPLPPVPTLSEHQQRGWRCCWCRWPLSPGYDQAVGEVRVAPVSGATYTVFLRACADTEECQARVASGESARSANEPGSGSAS